MSIDRLLAKLTSFSPEGQRISPNNARRRILRVKELLETRNLCVKDVPSFRLKTRKDDDPPVILSIAEEKAIARASIRLLELRSKGEARLHELLESLDVEKTSEDITNRTTLEDIFLLVKDIKRILPNKCVIGKHYVNFQIETIGSAEEENEILKSALEKNIFLSKEEREYLFSVVKVEDINQRYSALKTPEYLLPRLEIITPVSSTSVSHDIFRKENEKFEIQFNLTNEAKRKRSKKKKVCTRQNEKFKRKRT